MAPSDSDHQVHGFAAPWNVALASVQAPGDACIIQLPSGSFVTSPHTATFPDATRHTYPQQACDNVVVPWTSYQYVDQLYSSNSNSNSPLFSSISSMWTVPNAPSKVNGQTIYFWNGLEKWDLSMLLQPVLAYGQSSYTCNGKTCTVGGNYWYLASWEVIPGGNDIVSSIINVNPGDSITGYITWRTGGCGSYNSFYTGVAVDNTLNQNTVLNVCMGSQLTLAYGAVLEAWNIKTCDQFPNQNQPQPHQDFTSITSSSTPAATWQGTYTTAQPQCAYATDPMVQVRITSSPNPDNYTRSHGLSLDQPLPNPWWPPYQSGYEFLVTSTSFDYSTTYVFGQTGINHYVQEAASGFCPSYCWYSYVYINGGLTAQGFVDRATPVQANFVDQWTPNVRLFF